MKRMFVASLATFFVAASVFASMAEGPEENPGYELLNTIEVCDIVVVGNVESLTNVVRHVPMTDVTIAVEHLLKGEANVGTDKVRFAVLGGEGVDENGERYTYHVTHQCDFKVGQRALVFLKIITTADSQGAIYPYDGLKLAKGSYSKRMIKDDIVRFWYPGVTSLDTLKDVEMPINLAVKLGKAYVKEPEEARLIENVIKRDVIAATDDLVTVSPTQATRLIKKAQKILDKPTK